MGLFRTVALGVFLVGLVTFSQQVEALFGRSPIDTVFRKLGLAQQMPGFYGPSYDSVPEHKARKPAEKIPSEGDLKSWLEPAEGILASKSTPVHLAKVDPANGDILYGQIPNAWKNVGKRRYDYLDEVPRKIKANNKRKWTAESAAYSDTTTSTVPHVVYPKILVYADHALFKKLDYNVDETLEYILAFVNGVDLLYRKIEKPKIRFNIARIIIGVEEKSTPYIARNTLSQSSVDKSGTVHDAAEFFYSMSDVFPPNSYDAVMAITSMRLIGDYGMITMGMASRNGACMVNETRRLYRSLALVYDDGAFFGVDTAAHEFAHLFGALDEDKGSCGPEDGYIMSYDAEPKRNAHDFSACTRDAISDFFRNGGGRCLYDEPDVKDPLPRILPGSVKDRNQQCKAIAAGPSCYTGEPEQDPCLFHYCYNEPRYPNECHGFKWGIPADGTHCGNGKKCLHGKCRKFQTPRKPAGNDLFYRIPMTPYGIRIFK